MCASIQLQATRLQGRYGNLQRTGKTCAARSAVYVGQTRHQREAFCRAKSKDTLRQSFDSEDELDSDLAQELRAVADPERLKKLARHFELAWQISRSGRPQTCDCCKGEKEEECNWCHGTGYLMVGDEVYLSGSAHTNMCPVCKGKGYLKCERCRGTGFRAIWLPADTDFRP